MPPSRCEQTIFAISNQYEDAMVRSHEKVEPSGNFNIVSAIAKTADAAQAAGNSDLAKHLIAEIFGFLPIGEAGCPSSVSRTRSTAYPST